MALKKWITSASDAEVLRDCNRMLFEIKDVNVSSPMNIADTNLVRFERKYEQFDWESIGEVVIEKKTSSIMKMEIVSAFCTPEFGEIECIMQCQGGEVWIAEAGTYGLAMFNERGSEHKQELEEFEITSVATGNDGIRFISVPDEKSIYKISENDEVTNYCSLSSTPGDLAVFGNGNVAVCCNQPPKLMIIDETGEVSRQYAPRGTKFKELLRVAICKFTDILALCAQDTTNYTSTSTVEKGKPEKVQSQSGSLFNFTAPVSSGLKYMKGNIFLFDQKGNMMFKSKHQVHDLIFDHQGHLLVSLDEGNIDVLDNKGNILACLRPNGGDFLYRTIAIVSLNQLWIGQCGRINVFRYPDISSVHQG